MDGYFVSEDNKREIRALFNINDEELKVKVNMLQEWAKNSSDLPLESCDEDYLNIMLLRGKFDDETVKTNIENYFKCMSRYPEIFAQLGKFKPSEEVGVAIAAPKITPKWERIGILKLCPENMGRKNFDINQMILVTVTTGIIMFNNDYVPSVRFLLDFTGFTLRDLFKVNIRTLFKLVNICENILRIRIAGIELYNASRMMNVLLNMARLLLKPKMFSRVAVHYNLESLHKNISKECLPSDYGGELENTEELIKLWDNIIETQRPFFDRVANLSENSTNNNEFHRRRSLDID